MLKSHRIFNEVNVMSTFALYSLFRTFYDNVTHEIKSAEIRNLKS